MKHTKAQIDAATGEEVEIITRGTAQEAITPSNPRLPEEIETDEEEDGWAQLFAELAPIRGPLLAKWAEIINDQENFMLPRSPEEIGDSIGEFIDKVWYNRCHRHTLAEGPAGFDPKHWDDCVKAGKKVVRKYGKRNLGPYTDFEWGMINGKLSALRWVMGDDWDFLDT